MEEMQKHNMSWIEVQFLKKAVDVLCQCRQTLMFTYVFAFYLKKNNQSIIFEVSVNVTRVLWIMVKILIMCAELCWSVDSNSKKKSLLLTQISVTQCLIHIAIDIHVMQQTKVNCAIPG